MIRFTLTLVSALCLLSTARADPDARRAESKTWKQLADLHKAAAESGRPVKMKPHREAAEHFTTTSKGEPVAVTSYTDGTARTNRINSVIRTATLGAPVQLPEPPPGKHTKEYLLGFAAGVAATVAGLAAKGKRKT